MDCGGQGKVKIAPSGRILSKNWWYWGKLNLNWKHTNKYFYELLFDKENKLTETKDGKVKMKQIKNKDYLPKAKPKLLELWSHR